MIASKSLSLTVSIVLCIFRLVKLTKTDMQVDVSCSAGDSQPKILEHILWKWRVKIVGDISNAKQISSRLPRLLWRLYQSNHPRYWLA